MRISLVPEEDSIFENLPEATEAEIVAVLTDEKPLVESYFGTGQGREMLKRLYMSDQYSSKELADIFRTTKESITAFVGKQGWPAERDASRRDGEIALRRAHMRDKADQLKMTVLSVAEKGLDAMNTDYDGAMVVESAGKLRNLAQCITDISPADEQNNPAHNATLNIGAVFIKE